MGTRADFYIARDDGLEWLGSIAWDGYPEGIAAYVLKAKTSDNFGQALTAFFQDDRDDVTLPEMGWPWPWENSCTTDFAYVLIEGQGVAFSSFGGEAYWAAKADEDGEHERADIALSFPDMSARKNAVLGSRSGIITVRAA